MRSQLAVGQRVRLVNEGSWATVVQVLADGNLVVRKRTTEWLVGPEDVEDGEEASQ